MKKDREKQIPYDLLHRIKGKTKQNKTNKQTKKQPPRKKSELCLPKVGSGGREKWIKLVKRYKLKKKKYKLPII